MELSTLEKSLSGQLTNNHVSIVQTNTWCVPVHTVQVKYKPVIRTKMDILMKMLFHSLKETNFESAEQISDILLVEPLFVHDLLTKMQKTGLLTKLEGRYQLTDKGQQQFTNGVFEEEQDETTAELLYSPTHLGFLHGDIEEVLDFEDFPEGIFRYSTHEEQLTIDQDQVISEVRALVDEDGEEPKGGEKLFISAIEEVEDVQVNDVPCIEFLLHDKEKNVHFARIWNTLLGQWDSKLQHIVEEHEKE